MPSQAEEQVVESNLASALLKVLGSPVNLQILLLLTSGGMNTRQLSRVLGRSESDVSRRLRRMQELGLIRSAWVRVGGRNVKVYKLASGRLNIEISTRGIRIIDGTVSKVGYSGWSESLWRPPEPPGVFVGRRREMELIKQSLGSSRVIIITGLPGVGKTSLVSKWVREEALDNVFWHTFSHSDYQESLIRKIALFLSAKGRERLRDYLSMGDYDRGLALSIAVSELDSLAPLIVLDDVHRIEDPDLEDAISRLARESARLKMVLIGRQVPKIMARISEARIIHLEGLGKEETLQLAQHLAGKQPITMEQARALFKRTGGHPLLVRMMLELTGSRPVVASGLPTTSAPYQLFIEELSASLSLSEKKVLYLMACTGGQLDKEVLPSLLSKETEQWGLKRLLQRQIVVETPGEYQLKELVQEALTALLTPQECRPYSERLMRSLEKDVEIHSFFHAFRTAANWGYSDTLVQLARLRQAYIRHRILDYLPLYSKLLDKALKKPVTRLARAVLYNEKSVIAINLEGQPEKAMVLLKDAIPVLEEAREHLILAYAYSRLIMLDPDKAVEHARKAFWHTKRVPNPTHRHELLSYIHANLAYYYSVKRDYDKMIQHVEEEVRYAYLSGDITDYWSSVFHREMANIIAGGHGDVGTLARARVRLEELGSMDQPMIIAIYESLVHLIYNNPEEAARVASQYLEPLLQAWNRGFMDRRRLTQACNFAALAELAIKAGKEYMRDNSGLYASAQKLLREECPHVENMACFYRLARDLMEKGCNTVESPVIHEGCTSYDVDLFKRAAKNMKCENTGDRRSPR